MRIPVYDPVKMQPRRKCPVCGLWFAQGDGVFQNGSLVHPTCFDQTTTASAPTIRPSRPPRPILGSGTPDVSSAAAAITYPLDFIGENDES